MTSAAARIATTCSSTVSELGGQRRRRAPPHAGTHSLQRMRAAHPAVSILAPAGSTATARVALAPR